MKMSPLVSTWFIHAPKFHANLEIIAERQEKGHRWVLQIRTFGPRWWFNIEKLWKEFLTEELEFMVK